MNVKDMKAELDRLLKEAARLAEELKEAEVRKQYGMDGKPYPKMGTKKQKMFAIFSTPGMLTQDIVVLALQEGYARGSVINTYLDWLSYYGIDNMQTPDMDHEKAKARASGEDE